MNVTEGIDQIMTDVEGLGAADPGNTARRARILRAFIRVVTYVWLRRPWPFKKLQKSLTVPINTGFVAMPTDFGDITERGGVFLTSTGDQLRYIEPQEMMALKAQPGAETTTPEVYSVYGQDGTTYEPNLHIPLNSGGSVALTLWEDVEPPTLDESSNLNAIKKIPEEYHQTVLIPGVAAILRESKGDKRGKPFYEDVEFVNGLRQMMVNERGGRDTLSQLPSFFGG